jgi:hypothetical protein
MVGFYPLYGLLEYVATRLSYQGHSLSPLLRPYGLPLQPIEHPELRKDCSKSWAVPSDGSDLRVEE